MLKATLESLVDLFCEDHTETLMHMHSCRHLMRIFAERLGLKSEEIEMAEKAAFYHDVGKVFFRTIVQSARRLSPTEYDVIKMHTRYGAKALLECTDLPKDVVETAEFHHERWDGSGYYGLRNVEIPRTSRMMAIVDVYDSMRGERNYRPATDHGTAIAAIVDSTKFDPALTKVFVSIPKEELDAIIQTYHDPFRIKGMIEDKSVGWEITRVI